MPEPKKEKKGKRKAKYAQPVRGVRWRIDPSPMDAAELDMLAREYRAAMNFVLKRVKELRRGVRILYLSKDAPPQSCSGGCGQDQPVFASRQTLGERGPGLPLCRDCYLKAYGDKAVRHALVHTSQRTVRSRFRVKDVVRNLSDTEVSLAVDDALALLSAQEVKRKDALGLQRWAKSRIEEVAEATGLNAAEHQAQNEPTEENLERYAELKEKFRGQARAVIRTKRKARQTLAKLDQPPLAQKLRMKFPDGSVDWGETSLTLHIGAKTKGKTARPARDITAPIRVLATPQRPSSVEYYRRALDAVRVYKGRYCYVSIQSPEGERLDRAGPGVIKTGPVETQYYIDYAAPILDVGLVEPLLSWIAPPNRPVSIGVHTGLTGNRLAAVAVLNGPRALHTARVFPGLDAVKARHAVLRQQEYARADRARRRNPWQKVTDLIQGRISTAHRNLRIALKKARDDPEKMRELDEKFRTLKKDLKAQMFHTRREGGKGHRFRLNRKLRAHGGTERGAVKLGIHLTTKAIADLAHSQPRRAAVYISVGKGPYGEEVAKGVRYKALKQGIPATFVRTGALCPRCGDSDVAVKRGLVVCAKGCKTLDAAVAAAVNAAGNHWIPRHLRSKKTKKAKKTTSSSIDRATGRGDSAQTLRDGGPGVPVYQHGRMSPGTGLESLQPDAPVKAATPHGLASVGASQTGPVSRRALKFPSTRRFRPAESSAPVAPPPR